MINIIKIRKSNNKCLSKEYIDSYNYTKEKE
jgi:hypothetical protein